MTQGGGTGDSPRYLYLCSFPGLGGTQEYTFMLARKTAANGSTVLAMPFDPAQRHQFEGPFRALGGETLILPPDLYEPLNGRSYPGRISAGLRLRRLIHDRVPLGRGQRLVVHTNLSPMALAALAVWSDPRWIFVNTFHDFGKLTRRSISFLPNTIVLNLMSRRRCAFIVPSAHIADDLVTKVAAIGRDRVHVIHTGIDPLPAREERAAVPPLKFGMIGRVAEAKAPEIWIEAIGMFLAGGGRGEFHWYGQGPELAAMKQQAARAGIGETAIFHGYVEDAQAALDGFDVFVLSSRWEGGCFPRSVLEAMFRGVPCVLPALPSIMEAVGKRDCAVLYEAGNAASLASAFAAASSAPEALLQRARDARSLVLSNHAAEAEFRATADLYENLLGRTQ